MTSKEFMHVATAVDGEWLAELGENEVENIFFFTMIFRTNVLFNQEVIKDEKRSRSESTGCHQRYGRAAEERRRVDESTKGSS